jgi:two-component system response regulator HydG
MVEARRWIDAAASSDSAVWISGERGTGKEAVARAVHGRSVRRYMPFVTLGTTLPPAQLEAELLGVEQGPGGRARRRGKLELADGGTLFIDGVAALPGGLQEDLLRALQDRAVVRVDGERRIPIDVRPIAALELPPSSTLGPPGLRPDLHRLLSVIPIHLPPLRERREDIPLLVDHFLRRFGRKMNRAFDGVSDAALRALSARDWPGNVRELEIAIERAVLLREGGVIDESDLRFAPRDVPPGAPPRDERGRIVAALESCAWDLGAAAGLLGLDRAELFARMKSLGIERS